MLDTVRDGGPTHTHVHNTAEPTNTTQNSAAALRTARPCADPTVQIGLFSNIFIEQGKIIIIKKNPAKSQHGLPAGIAGSAITRGGRGEGPLASASYLLDLLALDDRIVPPYLLRPVLAVVKGAAVLVAVAMHGAEETLTPAREPCDTTPKCHYTATQ